MTTRDRLIYLIIVAIVVVVCVDVYFEDGITEAISVVLLVVTCIICRWIFDLRRNADVYWWQQTARIWLLVSLGFLFLAVDEAASLHERIDWLLHKYILSEETGMSDRIDDVLILVYGIIGLIVLWQHRPELRIFIPQMRYIWVGFAIMVIYVVFDVLHNRDDIFILLGMDDQEMSVVRRIVFAGEEPVKLLAEIFLMFGFLRIYHRAQELERTEFGS